jgi:hypothetical protein
MNEAARIVAISVWLERQNRYLVDGSGGLIG